MTPPFTFTYFQIQKATSMSGNGLTVKLIE